MRYTAPTLLRFGRAIRLTRGGRNSGVDLYDMQN